MEGKSNVLSRVALHLHFGCFYIIVRATVRTAVDACPFWSQPAKLRQNESYQGCETNNTPNLGLCNFVPLRPVTMETRCCPKNFEFQIYPPKDFLYRSLLAMSTILRKKSFKRFNTPPRKRQFLGRSWVKIGLRKTQPNVNSKRRDSGSSTDIDRQNQRLRHEI